MYQGPRIISLIPYLVCSSRNSSNQHHLPWLSRPWRSPTSPTAELVVIVSTLVQSSLQTSSIPTYKRAWKLFHQFLDNVSPYLPATMPISPANLALFIAYLYKQRYACSTVNTYVSALGYSHKLSGFVDPTKVFFIFQMLKGYGKINFRLAWCLPITLPILHSIVQAVDSMSLSLYDKSLLKAMCLFAFSTFSRIGKITANNIQ